MAKVDGKKIYRADVDKYYANQTAGSEQQPIGEQATSLRLSILNELIETEILMGLGGLLAVPEVQDVADFVLSNYSSAERKAVPLQVVTAADGTVRAAAST